MAFSFRFYSIVDAVAGGDTDGNYNGCTAFAKKPVESNRKADEICNRL